ncbi:GNAT family N-acetyltransferase [Kitasatospora sp. NBC_01266]|uniref:GNAT family N-acetyltransferase n=1 Tax=Kitasatospora sp. NBC_01266 TaxID=2903572 RepID=UPI002E31A5EF|nr:GNAT family N-acetyltransferase [Kitasatospora sp. NBC_01266]
MLRELALSDAPGLRRIYRGPGLRFLGRERDMDLSEAVERIGRALAARRASPRCEHTFGIDVDGDLVGLITMAVAPPDMPRLGYVLREDAWGHGYASEAVEVFLAYAFGLPGIEAVGARHHRGNAASGRVLVKAGFSRSSSLDEYVRYAVVRPGGRTTA